MALPTSDDFRKEMAELFKRKQQMLDDRFFQLLNATPRSPRNGRNRIPTPQTYRDSAQRAGARDDRAATLYPGGITYIPFRDTFGAWTSLRTVDVSDLLAPPEPPPPAPIPYAGVTVGEIIGYRAWWVVDTAVAHTTMECMFPDSEPEPVRGWRKARRLQSLASSYLWPPGEIVQGDTGKVVKTYFDLFVGPKQIFGGVYAFRSPGLDESTRQDINNILLRWDNRSLAIGTCTLWGDVVEHEHGYRASHARLRSIDAVYGPMGCPSAADLRREYGLEERT